MRRAVRLPALLLRRHRSLRGPAPRRPVGPSRPWKPSAARQDPLGSARDLSVPDLAVRRRPLRVGGERGEAGRSGPPARVGPRARSPTENWPQTSAPPPGARRCAGDGGSPDSSNPLRWQLRLRATESRLPCDGHLHHAQGTPAAQHHLHRTSPVPTWRPIRPVTITAWNHALGATRASRRPSHRCALQVSVVPRRFPFTPNPQGNPPQTARNQWFRWSCRRSPRARHIWSTCAPESSP